MADLKSLFDKMESSNGEGGSKKAHTIEKMYQKKTQLEHILLRPDTYIGTVEHAQEMMWVYNTDSNSMEQRKINFVPGLYKIFDEILVNAADNKQRDKSMDCIKIGIDQDSNTIYVWNNGKGIPVTMHKEEKMYVPTMIFGHLLTSSNYNDEEDKVTGGRNGYGAKLCNIFSTKFVVETGSREFKKTFRQTWESNMTKTSDPKVKDFNGEDFTKITFKPDLSKFNMEKLDDDIVALMMRRAYDIAASTQGVKVFLNDKKLPVKSFKDYVDLYVKGKEDDCGNAYKVVHEKCNERWEVAITSSDNNFQQVSFVNSIATTKGGKHVDYIVDMIVKQLTEVLKKRNKSGVVAKPSQIKNHMWVFINCLIVNPRFDSQTKETMTLQAKSFGSKCSLTEKFITGVSKCGIVELVLNWAKSQAQNQLNKQSGKKTSKLKNVPKLEDANDAGTKNALKCTLILTEGDSAKSLAVSGLGVIGRDLYGVFPLRGKLLNVREATHKQIYENAEINNLIKILGLKYKTKYNTDESMKTLRYGKVMIMTDQDQDGSHIKGLLINFIHHNWPELLRRDFLEEFITPIVKCSKRGEVLSFYSLPEFEEWKKATANHHTYTVKYYKGLGTSTSTEAKEYFSNMERHRIKFKYSGQQDDDHILLAFSKKHIEQRKEWLTNFMVETKRRKEIGLQERYLYTQDTKRVSYTDFVNLELVLFSNADNVRSIPSLVDGLKPGQRKVLFTCFKRNDKREVKVAQLAGSVAEHSAYHHGEVSLCSTIVNLAQNFVGSNNINLLEPRGQFGTRLNGGKDSASPRYIFTKLSPLARLIFHPQDDPLLMHEYDDNQKIEPVWYIPILPMVLVNGADGIGTGWMTKIPNYNPREICQNLLKMLDDEEPQPMIPWYKNFHGTIEDCGDHRYAVSGEVAVLPKEKLEITELPIGTWTQHYKEHVLEPLLQGSEKAKAAISDYKEYNTDTTIRFVVICQPAQMQNMEKDGIHKVLKLQSMIHTSSMCVFDELGCLRRYESVMDILGDFYKLRMVMYKKRKTYLEGMLQSESSKLSNQARFIMEKCDGTLTVENKKRKDIVKELIKRNYDPDPIAEWKSRNQVTEDNFDQSIEDDEDASDSKKGDDQQDTVDFKKYDYLLGMSMWMLTDERKRELLKQRDSKLDELNVLKQKTPSDLWRADITTFLTKLDQVERQERSEESSTKEKKGAVKKGPISKKKVNLLETLPSPAAQRVVPKVTEEMKKKIQLAVKAKEKSKKIKRENIAEEERDEFDLMVQGTKSLKDKVGTPEEAEKKAKAKKGKDGFKQTKLNFKPKEDKSNGVAKKKSKNKWSDSDDNSDEGSDFSTDFKDSPVKERISRRAAAKKVNYSIDSPVEGDTSDKEDEIDDVVRDVSSPKRERVVLEDSDNEAPPPAPQNASLDDLFDSLIGKKNSSPPASPKASKDYNSDSELFSSEEQAKPAGGDTAPARKKRVISDSDFSDDSAPKKKTASKKKRACSDSDEDFNVGVAKKAAPKGGGRKKKDAPTGGLDSDEGGAAKKKKAAAPKAPRAPKAAAKPKKKAASSSDDDSMKIVDDDDDDDFKPTARPPRTAKPTKYTFDSDESD